MLKEIFQNQTDTALYILAHHALNKVMEVVRRFETLSVIVSSQNKPVDISSNQVFKSYADETKRIS